MQFQAPLEIEVGAWLHMEKKKFDRKKTKNNEHLEAPTKKGQC